MRFDMAAGQGENMQHQKMTAVRALQWALLALTLVFIWGHSCMPVENSAAESGRVMGFLAPYLEWLVGKGGVTDHLVRKLAHFTEFTALGVQLLLLRRGTAGKDAARAVEYGFFAAFLDESIQILSARGPQIADVWLDTAGTAFGVAVAVLVRMLLRSSNIRRA